MIAAFKHLVAAPLFEDQVMSRTARLLHTVLLLTAGALLLGAIITLIFQPGSPVPLIALALLVVMVALLRLVLAGHVRLVSWLYLVGVWAYLGSASLVTDGLRTPTFSAHFLAIVLAGLLLGGKGALVLAGASSLSGVAILIVESAGRLPEPVFPGSPISTFAHLVLLFFITAAAVYFSRSDLELVIAQSREKELELARMERAFQAEQARLEERVAERTRALVTSAEVSQRLSTILDQEQLVAEVVEQIRRAFDYYHAHIYLFDESGQQLLMVGGTGEAGRAMLVAGHKLARGRGLVGQAAESRRAVIVPDVTAEPAWLPNPLLPETRAEIAVPIIAGDDVLGVLDVQHNVSHGLQEGDSILLQTIANQVAVALENARLYGRAQRLASHEALANTIGQRIQRATTIEGVLQVAAQELGQAFAGGRTIVQLASPAGGNGELSHNE
jgi:GAF domain-containing protein